MRVDADLAVVGSGFSGSLTALVARRLGLSVALIERGAHPRFAIGESSSPLANLLLESLADRYGLERVRPLAKWGSWKRAHPDVRCGLKRGFTFYAHRPGARFAADPDRGTQLLVAASPRDEIADTHWYRPDFDHFLVREAESAGAVYLERTRVRVAELGEDAVRLDGERPQGAVEIRARSLVDASGPRGFLHRELELPEASFCEMPPTAALYTHFRDVARMDELEGTGSREAPPYPIDDAALHHAFPGGWIWVLRFDDGIVSAGVAATEPFARALGLAEGEAGWLRLLETLPTVREQFQGARPIHPFVFRSPLPFRSSRAAGPGWVQLPSAAGFVDPLLSTGFPLTLAGVERLGRILETDWGTGRLSSSLAALAERSLFETDAAALLVAALYAAFSDFPLFCELSKLYFAAASYSEARRRLSGAERADSFLCADRPGFGSALTACCRRAIELASGSDRAAREGLLRDLARAIEPIDVAGLSDRSRRNWYPVEAEDLRASAGKLGSTRAEVDAMLTRCGFFSPSEEPSLSSPITPRLEETSSTRRGRSSPAASIRG